MTLSELLMSPTSSKEMNVNFGIVNEYQARFLSQAILSWFKEQLPKEKDN
jgi:hypothetical protein